MFPRAVVGRNGALAYRMMIVRNAGFGGEDFRNQVDAATSEQADYLRTAVERLARYRALSTLPYTKSAEWSRCIDTVAPRASFMGRLTSRVGIPDPALILRLLWRANRYDVVLLAGGERADLLYLALAGILPWIRTPHVIVDAHWQKSAGLAGVVQTLLLRMGRRLTRQVQPHSPEEIEIYRRLFAIPEERMRAIPWSTTLTGYDIAVPDVPEDFILTGGYSFRDYDTFLRAVRSLPVRVEIGIPRAYVSSQVFVLATGNPNVSIVSDWDNRQYLNRTAQCRIFAMPISPGMTRCTADQTILNAMYLGRIVVATDSIASRLYIQDGVNGFLVREGSIEDWLRVLRTVLALDPERDREVRVRAAYDARVHFNEALRIARTLHAAADAIEGVRVETPAYSPSGDA